MNILITGSTGFIGTHLCKYFINQHSFSVYGTTHNKKGNINRVIYIKIDLTNLKSVESLIQKIQPDFIFHLAAQSLIIPSWDDPISTLQFNIFSTLNILESLKKNKAKTRMFIFGSSSEYESINKPIKEKEKINPQSPYALSKFIQDNLGYLYYKAYGLDIIRVRPFSIIGPKKENDAVSDFARKIVEIEKGNQEKLSVGNLNAIRDFLDIQDALDAIKILMKKGKSGEVYNISSGKPIQVNSLVKHLTKNSQKEIKIVVNKTLYRPIDEKMRIGDNSKLKKLGWAPKISLDKSLKNILEYWRNKDF